MSGRSRLALAVLVAAVVPGATAGAAEPASSPAGVIVLRPPADDRVLEETSWRVRSELDAAGMSSRMVDCAPNAAGGGCGGDDISVARISLSREEGVVAITVAATLPDGLELRRRMRVDPAQGGDEPSVIAVRAVELLRDIYLDIPRATRAAPPVVPAPRVAPSPGSSAPPVSAPLPASAAYEPRAGRVFAGIGVLSGRRGLGPAAAPYAGVALGLGRLLALATVAGPFSERLGRIGERQLDVDQSLLTLGLRYEIGAWWVRPFGAAATGLHYVGVQPPTSGTGATSPAASSLAPLLAVGAGVSVPLWKWLMFSTEMSVLVSDPSVDVTIRGELIGRAGAPSFLAQAGFAIAPQ